MEQAVSVYLLAVGVRWILAYSGVSGNGKSTLADWLIEKRCKPNSWRWGKVDFAINLPVEAVPPVLAFLNRNDEALMRYEEALGLSDLADQIVRPRIARAKENLGAN